MEAGLHEVNAPRYTLYTIPPSQTHVSGMRRRGAWALAAAGAASAEPSMVEGTCRPRERVRNAARCGGVVLTAADEVRTVGPHCAEGRGASTYTSWATRWVPSERWALRIADLGFCVVKVRRWGQCGRREWEQSRTVYGRKRSACWTGKRMKMNRRALRTRRYQRTRYALVYSVAEDAKEEEGMPARSSAKIDGSKESTYDARGVEGVRREYIDTVICGEHEKGRCSASKRRGGRDAYGGYMGAGTRGGTPTVYNKGLLPDKLQTKSAACGFTKEQRRTQ
ncbi:hypothetical protein B0H14DRAFT_2621156 [Mycena olivaceomarginata]|nr:hypothetical protein B0H14DRAFT_2621156 [Mycena olivaceomarginata]